MVARVAGGSREVGLPADLEGTRCRASWPPSRRVASGSCCVVGSVVCGMHQLGSMGVRSSNTVAQLSFRGLLVVILADPSRGTVRMASSFEHRQGWPGFGPDPWGNLFFYYYFGLKYTWLYFGSGLFNVLRVGSWSMWGSGRPRGPGDPSKRWEAKPPPFARVSGAPGAAQTPKMIDLRPFNNSKIL